MPKRSIRTISAEISQLWPNVNYVAKPYLEAMHNVQTIEDVYMCINGKSLIMYFLANASTWRGPDARRIKAELNGLIK